VPSHCGIQGNEHADAVASDFDPAVQADNLSVCHRDLKATDKAGALIRWQNLWCNSTKGRYFFNLSPTVNAALWFRGLNLPRHIVTFINRLKFNHTRCKDHLFKIKIIDNNSCSCGGIQSPQHILADCRDVDPRDRAKLIDIARNAGLTSVSIQSLIQSSNKKVLFALYDFFKSTDIEI